MDLALNNLQWLMYHKTKSNQTGIHITHLNALLVLLTSIYTTTSLYTRSYVHVYIYIYIYVCVQIYIPADGRIDFTPQLRKADH